jgi:hypothetical protein
MTTREQVIQQSIDQQNATTKMPPLKTIKGLTKSLPMTPMDMLAKAVQGNVDPQVLKQLLDLQERWQANIALVAFDEAIAAAKQEIPVVVKNRTGHNNKKYADFSAYVEVVDPVLSKHGISYRFRTTQNDNRITVTCVLVGHGHHEENSLSGPADKTGSKNEIQAIGSTLTYLQRYTLVQALGLAAAEDDDGGAGETINDEQFNTLNQLIGTTHASYADFCKLLKVDDLANLPARQFDSAVALLKAKHKIQKGKTDAAE